MFKSGNFTSQYVTQADGSKVPDKQIQPHGVELTVDKIFRCRRFNVLGDSEYTKAQRKEANINEAGKYKDLTDGVNHDRLKLEEIVKEDEVPDKEMIELDKPHYTLPPGPYVVRYNEKIRIPRDHMGLVFPRSRLIRSGNFLSTAVWDSGYEGRGEGGLHINSMSFVEKGMRIGQIVLAHGNSGHMYSGSHQGENLEDTGDD